VCHTSLPARRCEHPRLVERREAADLDDADVEAGLVGRREGLTSTAAPIANTVAVRPRRTTRAAPSGRPS
jgi:hypothetical protein